MTMAYLRDWVYAGWINDDAVSETKIRGLDTPGVE